MSTLIGIDEAGRGPLAGPVVVGLIRVPETFDLLAAFPGLNDSKKLSEKKRETLFELLEERVRTGDVRYTVLLRSAKEIDEQGIAVVIRSAIAEGLELLSENVGDAGGIRVQLDGALRAPSPYTQETIIGGDALIPSIMLASVAAKVVRDRHMLEMHEQYPEYSFAQHKGYGTKLHIERIREHGPCAIHRTSFTHL
jgi:ribonuclease HII